jgi:ankyrin repeat protein
VKPDVCAAAALGRMDLLGDAFDRRGRLRHRPRRGGRLMSERDAVGLALLFAYVNRHPEAVDFLFEKDGNWNMTGVNNGTALHRAAWSGDLAMVQRLVAKGADPANRDNPFVATPLSWAQHNRQALIVAWLRAHCAIDLHDAAGFGLREHVVARLREAPKSVNARRDQWDIPDSTPLHGASWPSLEDVDGRQPKDPASSEELLTLLLDHGADPNLIAGNGLTALDIAIAGKAEDLAAILQDRGGKRAGEL